MNNKPTIEEVREYFKNAAEIECLFDRRFYDLSKLEITKDYNFFNNGVWLEVLHEMKNVKIWSKEKGYTKIITYKNNTEITEQQIKDLESGIVKVKELFPDVFKEKIESGFWYKHEKSGCLAFVCEVLNNDFVGYGFNPKKNWVNKNRFWTNSLETWKLATNEEVEDALKNEAVKRGFENGLKIKRNFDDLESEVIINKSRFPCDERLFYELDNSGKPFLECYGFVIFHNGIWAEIIPQDEKLYTEKDLVDFGNKVLQDAQNNFELKGVTDSQIENFKLNR